MEEKRAFFIQLARMLFAQLALRHQFVRVINSLDVSPQGHIFTAILHGNLTMLD